MTWLAWVSVILAFIEKLPELAALLRELFDRAHPEGDPADLEPRVAVARLFAAARPPVWKVWQWGTRAKLAVVERIVSRRADQLSAVANGVVAMAPLTDDEWDALLSA